MDSMTQQNAAMVKEATAAARSLATEADELTTLVARFRLRSQSAADQYRDEHTAHVAPMRVAAAR
jgi:methyl-accepting chemotaxis protein